MGKGGKDRGKKKNWRTSEGGRPSCKTTEDVKKSSIAGAFFRVSGRKKSGGGDEGGTGGRFWGEKKNNFCRSSFAKTAKGGPVKTAKRGKRKIKRKRENRTARVRWVGRRPDFHSERETWTRKKGQEKRRGNS